MAPNPWSLVMVSPTEAKKSISFYFLQPLFVAGILCPFPFVCLFEFFHYALLPRNKPNGEDPKTVTKEKEDKEEEMVEVHWVTPPPEHKRYAEGRDNFYSAISM